MLKYFSIFLVLVLLGAPGLAQESLNMELRSTVGYPQGCNDIWSWVDTDGTEYAILGTETGTAILNLTDPDNPEEVNFIPGTNTTWRDMKSWEDHVYVVADNAPDGILIIDMSQMPDTATWNYWVPQIQVGQQLGNLQSCHNIWIDDQGIAFLSGCNVGNGGVIMFDVDANPEEPVLLGAADQRYSHDCFARGDTLWTADIYAGIFTAYDVSNPSQPIELATQQTSFLFTHNVWLSDDGNYLFTTDERANAYVDAFDVSDLSNIRRIDRFRPAATEGQGVIPHNAHYYDGYLVVSWYTDGVRIIDAHRPENLVEVAFYDTNTDFNNGFHGSWGTTPYLPSGLVLASDRENGLFVMDADYVRASYLEGTIKDQSNGSAISGAAIIIDSDQANSTISEGDGQYKTGLAGTGTYDILVEALGYESKIVSADLAAGQVTNLDIELQPLPSYSIRGNTILASDGTPLPGIQVVISNEDFEFSGTSDANGIVNMTNVFGGTYELVAGAWGYNQYYIPSLEIQENEMITVQMEPGYEDDFILDQGWTVGGDAMRGTWERGEPIGTGFAFFQVSPEYDADDDIGDQCYVTGNGGQSAGFDDIDNGSTLLSSPVMNLSSYEEPVLSFQYWFMNVGGNGDPDDSLEVFVSNPTDTVKIFNVSGENSEEGWKKVENLQLKEYLNDLNNVQIHFLTYDLLQSQLVEAGIDAFAVSDGMVNSVNGNVPENNIQINLNPNPADQYVDLTLTQVALSGNKGIQLIQLLDARGQVLRSERIPAGINRVSKRLHIAELPAGLYFIRYLDNQIPMMAKKLIVH